MAVAAESGPHRPRYAPRVSSRACQPLPRPRVRCPRRGCAPATASVSRGRGRLRRPPLRAQATAFACAPPVAGGLGACASGVCRASLPSEPRGAVRGLCCRARPRRLRLPVRRGAAGGGPWAPWPCGEGCCPGPARSPSRLAAARFASQSQATARARGSESPIPSAARARPASRRRRR